MRSSVSRFIAEEWISCLFVVLPLAAIAFSLYLGYTFIIPAAVGLSSGGAIVIVRRLRKAGKHKGDLRDLQRRLGQLSDSSLPILKILAEEGPLFSDQIAAFGHTADGDRILAELLHARLVDSIPQRRRGKSTVRLSCPSERWSSELVLTEIGAEAARREQALAEPAPPLGPRSRASSLAH